MPEPRRAAKRDPKEDLCTHCERKLSADPYEVCHGESGKPYCSEDCRAEAVDEPSEED